jgi:hypothetical protein
VSHHDTTTSDSPARSDPSTSTRSSRPRTGEPPVLVDPRRWGALIGVAGGLVFVASYAPPLGRAVLVTAGVVGGVLAVMALLHLYVRPFSLGPLREPSRRALLVYGLCVVGELAAIGAGTRLLTRLGEADLRPALIAGVVGVHFLPFAWAFGERMFYRLGLALLVLGAAGLVAGAAGVTLAPEAAAVLSGLVMLALVVRYSRGHYAARRP